MELNVTDLVIFPFSQACVVLNLPSCNLSKPIPQLSLVLAKLRENKRARVDGRTIILLFKRRLHFLLGEEQMKLLTLYKLTSPHWVARMMSHVKHAFGGNFLEFSLVFYNIHNIYIMYKES